MDNKVTKILKGQIRKLNSKEFDLEAWKSSTIALLSKAFSEEDPLVQEIQKLKIDYGSWALRDAKASYNPMETCKKIGKEVVEIAIEQLETSGETNKSSKAILEKELKQSKLEPIFKVMRSNKSPSVRKSELIKILKKLEPETLSSLLAQFILKKD